jgi:YVTN family beta-propeller protein
MAQRGGLINNAVHFLKILASTLQSAKCCACHFTEANGIRISPHGIGLNPQTGKFYSLNTTQNIVTVLDQESFRTTQIKSATIRLDTWFKLAFGHLLARVQVGQEPESIAVNPDTDHIYVASGSGTVTVIDGATDKAVTNIAVGDLPYLIAG